MPHTVVPLAYAGGTGSVGIWETQTVPTIPFALSPAGRGLFAVPKKVSRNSRSCTYRALLMVLERQAAGEGPELHNIHVPDCAVQVSAAI